MYLVNRTVQAARRDEPRELAVEGRGLRRKEVDLSKWEEECRSVTGSGRSRNRRTSDVPIDKVNAYAK